MVRRDADGALFGILLEGDVLRFEEKRFYQRRGEAEYQTTEVLKKAGPGGHTRTAG
jgi:hypothetical protein